MGKNFDKTISKNLTCKYSQKLHDHAINNMMFEKTKTKKQFVRKRNLKNSSGNL